MARLFGLLALLAGMHGAPAQTLPSPRFATQPGTQNDNTVATTAHVKAAIQAAIGTSHGTIASGAMASGILNIMDMGVPNVGTGPAVYTPANAVNDTLALTNALAIISGTTGNELYFPCGNYSFTSPGYVGFVLAQGGDIRMQGLSETCVKIFFNDFVNGNDLFTNAGTQANPTTGSIYIDGMTFVGTWDTSGPETQSAGQTHIPGIPLYFAWANNVNLSNLTVMSSRAECFRTEHITGGVRYSYLHAIKCARDALSAQYSPNVTVEHSSCLHNGDDGISISSLPDDPGGPRSSIVVDDNRLFDCGAIHILGARSFNVHGNHLDFAKNIGISIGTSNYQRNDDEGSEAALDGTVSGNTITNCTTNIITSNPGQAAADARCSAFQITADSSNKGGLTNYPGLGATPGSTYAPNGVIDVRPYYFSNPGKTTGATTPVPPSGRFVFSNNTVSRTVPPADGTVTGFNSVLDYGSKFAQGQFYASGWYTGPVTMISLQPDAIQMNVGVMEGISFVGNHFTGMLNCLNLRAAVQIDNLMFDNNECIDYSGAGIVSAVVNPIKVYAQNNIFDGDPLNQSPLRGPNGTWTSGAVGSQMPIGILTTGSSGGIFLKNNWFKNVYRVWQSDTSANNSASGSGATAVTCLGNIAEALPVVGGFSTHNRGIGVIDPESPCLAYVGFDYTPTDGNFNGAVPGTSMTMSATAAPTTGFWAQNRRLTNTAPTPVNGYIVDDWYRATFGNNNVLGVDWIPELKPVYQPAQVYTATGIIGANDNVSLCNNPGTSMITLTVPAGTAANDNLPHILAQVPGGGPCQASVPLAGGQSQLLPLDAANGNVPASSTVSWQQSLNGYVVVN